MTAYSFASLQAVLLDIGCSIPVSEAVLRPGHERNRLLTDVLGRLLDTSNTEPLLSKLGLDANNAGERLSEDEQLAYRLSILFNSLGIPATLEAVRGSMDYEENITFLVSIAYTAQLKHRLMSSAAQVQIGRSPVVAQAQLLEHACENISQLAAESTTFWPSDICKALQPFSTNAEHLLNNGSRLIEQLGAETEFLQQQVDMLLLKAQPADQCEWEAATTNELQALQGFLVSAQQFVKTYDKELRVWCESSQAPPTHGFGQQAVGMLQTYQQLSAVIEDVAVAHKMHAALASSATPLQAFQPSQLALVASQGQAEVERLSRELKVLQAAAARRAAGQTEL